MKDKDRLAHKNNSIPRTPLPRQSPCEAFSIELPGLKLPAITSSSHHPTLRYP